MATFTKEELKNALIQHGVSPPSSSARKDEYVALYEQHIAPIEAAKGDFSADDDDDDEEVTISPRKKPKSTTVSKSSKRSISSKKSSKSSVTNKIVNDILDMVVGDTTVAEMTDDELFVALRQNGVDAGPIVDSTRDIYKRKLVAVLTDDDDDPVVTSNGVEFSDTEPESPDSSVNVTNGDDDQPDGVSSPVTRRSNGVGKKSSSSSSSKTASRSGLRQRFGLDKEDVSEVIRNTPTARRSIHSYKVTETTTHHVTRTKDGLETRDSTHTIVKTENTGVDDKPSRLLSWLKAFLRRLLLLLLIALILIALYYVYVKLVKTTDHGVVKKVQDAIKEAANKAAEAFAPPPNVTEAPPPVVEEAPPAPNATEAPPPVTREPVPEQPSLADV